MTKGKKTNLLPDVCREGEKGEVMSDNNAKINIREIIEERDMLRRWVADLQSKMYINCVYCGWRAGEQGEGVSADVLKAHVEQCPEHPFFKLRKKYDQLVGEYNELAEEYSKLYREEHGV